MPDLWVTVLLVLVVAGSRSLPGGHSPPSQPQAKREEPLSIPPAPSLPQLCPETTHHLPPTVVGAQDPTWNPCANLVHHPLLGTQGSPRPHTHTQQWTHLSLTKWGRAHPNKSPPSGGEFNQTMGHCPKGRWLVVRVTSFISDFRAWKPQIKPENSQGCSYF